MATALMQSFLNDLNADQFQLSSLPEVAMKIRRALKDPDISAEDIAALINNDPAIAAKVLRMSNSVFFRGRTTCDTVSAGVARMGFETTRKLVTSFAVKDLFKSESAVLNEAMQAAWERSLLIGAIAHALATHTSLFSPEEAMLAGILSNIGVLSVFNYVNNHPSIAEDKVQLDATVAELKTEVGALVLDRWAFPADYLACALESENWMRDTGKPADLCDLVILANYHANIGERDLPALGDLPVFWKVAGQNLNPELAADFLLAAQDQINEASSMLAA